MDDQTIDTNPPAGVSKPEQLGHRVTAVDSSVPDKAGVSPAPTKEEESEENEDDQLVSPGKTPRNSQLIKEVRERLDELWEAQRESIIATIKGEDLDPAYEHTRKRRREILEEIRKNTQQFCRQAGLVKKWIRELTREEDGALLDYKHRFRDLEVGHEAERFKDLCRWLEKKGLAERPGCYCFRNDDEYVYIGRATVLIDRIKQHEDKTYFTFSNAIRIVIPYDKWKLEKLERLLIFAHSPTKFNDNLGTLGGPLDDCLGFLEREVNELIEDAPRRELS